MVYCVHRSAFISPPASIKRMQQQQQRNPPSNRARSSTPPAAFLSVRREDCGEDCVSQVKNFNPVVYRLPIRMPTRLPTRLSIRWVAPALRPPFANCKTRDAALWLHRFFISLTRSAWLWFWLGPFWLLFDSILTPPCNSLSLCLFRCFL